MTAPRGRPAIPAEERRTYALQLRLTPEEGAALERLRDAVGLAEGRDVPLAEVGRDLLLESPRLGRLLSAAPAEGRAP